MIECFQKRPSYNIQYNPEKLKNDDHEFMSKNPPVRTRNAAVKLPRGSMMVD
jgi:hypothetical protein